MERKTMNVLMFIVALAPVAALAGGGDAPAAAFAHERCVAVFSENAQVRPGMVFPSSA